MPATHYTRAPHLLIVAALAALSCSSEPAVESQDSAGHEQVATAGAPTDNLADAKEKSGPKGDPNSMIEKGSRVKMTYQAKDEKGEVVDSSPEKGPIQFVVGKGQLQPSVEAMLMGMKIGQNKTFSVENAYGEHDPTKTGKMDKKVLPEGTGVGNNVKLVQGYYVPVIGVDEHHVIIDINHPLAGQTITFEVTIEDVINPTKSG